jgi:hypothetical protein
LYGFANGLADVILIWVSFMMPAPEGLSGTINNTIRLMVLSLDTGGSARIVTSEYLQ